MHKLKEKLWKELDEISDKPDLSAGDLEAAHKLTDTIKSIDKICMLEESGGYSGAHRGMHTAPYPRDGSDEDCAG